MTQSTQTKVMKAIESAAHDYGFEVVVDSSYSNDGRLSIESTDSFEPVLQFSFRFNTGSFHFDGIKPHLPGIGQVDKGSTQGIGVWQGEKFGTSATADEVIKAIRDHLARVRGSITAKELA